MALSRPGLVGLLPILWHSLAHNHLKFIIHVNSKVKGVLGFWGLFLYMFVKKTEISILNFRTGEIKTQEILEAAMSKVPAFSDEKIDEFAFSLI